MKPSGFYKCEPHSKHCFMCLMRKWINRFYTFRWDSSSILQIDGKICKKVHLPRQKLPGETAHRKRRKGGIQRVIVLPEGWSLEILLSYPLVWKLVGEIKKMSPIANIVRSQVLLLDNHCSILILPRPTSRNSTLSYQRFFKRRMLTW